MKFSLSLLLFLICFLPLFSCTSEETIKKPYPGSSSLEEAASSSDPLEKKAVEEGSTYDGVFPWHQPYGVGVGAMPGRVVWAHDPNAVAWNGDGYWWELKHFDEERIYRMVQAGIA